MTTREAYTTCMKSYMTGGGPDRKERFCIGAKVCSGKTKDESEAKKLCAEAAANPKPKNPGNPSRRGKFCTLRDLDSVATCTASNIDLSTLTRENMHEVFAKALEKCSGGKAVAVKKAKKSIEDFSPQEIEALKTMALLSKEAEGRVW